MSNLEIGALVLTLSSFIFLVHVMGYIFEKFWQPRLVGEILAGIVLGPFVLGKLAPGLFATLFTIGSSGVNKAEIVLSFIYWIGLFLLMFLSGTETRRLMGRENQRETAWLLAIGTSLPFFVVLGLGLTKYLPLTEIVGTAKQPMAALLILAIAVAVTSIPVISRIFLDLGIMQTRFASLMLGFAVLEDIVLWGVLAVATAIAAGGQHLAHDISVHIVSALGYMVLALTLMPKLLKKIHDARWNLLIKASPVGYLFFVLFLYASIAALMDVNLIFAAFLAGFGLTGGIQGSERARFEPQMESISKVARGVFIPLYFGLVGYKLTWGREFSLAMFLLFLLASSVISLVSFSIAARLAGFRGMDIVNLAITKNARGGPGIVLASVAFEAGIINAAFYTTLVLTAVLTSQAAGAWLRYILHKRIPLLLADGEMPNQGSGAKSKSAPIYG